MVIGRRGRWWQRWVMVTGCAMAVTLWGDGFSTGLPMGVVAGNRPPSSSVAIALTSPLLPIGQFEAAPCPSLLLTEALARLGDRLRCGFVTVPERHADPTGSTIRLAVAQIRSDRPQAQPDPLVMAQGGPGGSTLMLLEPWWEAIAATPGLSDRDLVLIEQRGTQFSQPYLFCQEIYEVDRQIAPQLPQLSEEVINQKTLAAYGACRDRLLGQGIDLGAYNSWENADDIPLVMSALGYGRFNFYGVSYGTMLGQHLMKRHPDRLRSVILDAVVPLNTNYITESLRSHDRALRQLFEQCQRSPVCQREYPRLQETFQAVVAQLERQPITTEGFDAIAYVDAQLQAGRSGRVLADNGEQFWRTVAIDGDGLVNLVISALYDSSLIPQLPEWLREMRSGDWSSLTELASDWFSPLADGMQQSVLCAEEAGFTPLKTADLGSILPELRSLSTDPQEFLDSCRLWPVPTLGPEANRPVSTNIPTLLLSGNLDPVTPPPFGNQVAASLSRAYHYTFPGLGHGAFASSDCANRLVRDFLRNPNQAPDGRCVAQVQFMPQVPIIPALQAIAVWGTRVRSLVPLGWQRDPILTNLWRSPETEPNEGRISFTWVVGTTGPQALQRLGLTVPLIAQESQQVGGRTWQLYASPQSPVQVAATTDGQDTYLITVESLRQRSRQAILQGAIAGFQLAPTIALPPKP
ncbi:alpha/beta hydrolase [Limnothrix redekei]|uniref:Alpha/beta hydrolase n=1 Tax=Limnothrix redekei LRLZ20PSL1 TaxID=3112953 RepID=A0ABW7CCI1_9CYAN